MTTAFWLLFIAFLACTSGKKLMAETPMGCPETYGCYSFCIEFCIASSSKNKSGSIYLKVFTNANTSVT
jgi:hypothetical protein